MFSLFRRYRIWFTTAGAALIAIWLYWPSLNLPIIYDDLLHIRITKGLNLATVWYPTDQFGFYRPFTFFPLILIKELFGFHPNWLLHGLNVAQHSLNVILLITLSWRLWHNQTRAIVAGLLFAFFPFSYQAIAVYGHNVHPTIAGLILAGLHTYLTAIQRDGKQQAGGRRLFWWSTTGFIFLLSLLTHESAILFGAFAALVHWNEEGKLPQLAFSSRPFRARHLPPWFIFLFLGAVYAIGYQFLPISRGPQASDGSGGSGWPRILYVLQAAAYPLSWFAHRVPDVGASPLVLVSTTITIGFSAWAARLRENWLPFLLAWGWWGLACLVVAVPLPTNYVLHGPRLLYLSSLGVALAWSVLLLPNQKKGVFGKIGFGLAFAFILMTNWQFVRERFAQYGQLTSPIDEMARVMAERPPDEGIVVVNLPQWLAPSRNTYPVGAELVAMLGNYLFADEIVIENIPGEHTVYSVVVPGLLGTPAYPYGIHDESVFREDAPSLPVPSHWSTSGSQVFIVRYGDNGPETIHSGSFKPTRREKAPIASLGPYELLEASGLACDGSIQVSLVLSQPGTEPVQPTVSLFVQVLADDGRLIAQADGPPLGLRPDFIQLSPEWSIQDQRVLQPSEPGQPTQLLIGAYDFATGERFPAYDRQLILLSDNAYRLPVTACP